MTHDQESYNFFQANYLLDNGLSNRQYYNYRENICMQSMVVIVSGRKNQNLTKGNV